MERPFARTAPAALLAVPLRGSAPPGSLERSDCARLVSGRSEHVNWLRARFGHDAIKHWIQTRQGWGLTRAQMAPWISQRHGDKMAGRRSERPSLGESVRLPVHFEALTAIQRRILQVCSKGASSWGTYLAGAAARALHFGHRRSDDFDWLGPRAVPPADLLKDAGRCLTRGFVARHRRHEDARCHPTGREMRIR